MLDILWTITRFALCCVVSCRLTEVLGSRETQIWLPSAAVSWRVTTFNRKQLPKHEEEWGRSQVFISSAKQQADTRQIRSKADNHIHSLVRPETSLVSIIWSLSKRFEALGWRLTTTVRVTWAKCTLNGEVSGIRGASIHVNRDEATRLSRISITTSSVP